MINWQLSKQVIRWTVSPDRTAGSSVGPSRSSMFRSYPLTNYQFQMIAGSSYFFQWFTWNMLCLSHYGPSLLGFWFQTDLGRENSARFLKLQAGKTFSCHGHTLVTHYVQFLFSDWSKFHRRVHAENLCSMLKVVYFDSWSWQCFVSTCCF